MAESSLLDVESFLEPIRPDSPAGDYLRWEDDEYAALEAAREEEEDARSQDIYKRDRKKADWDRVIEVGAKLLRKKTKDLMVAAWIADALARKRGLAGIRDGFRLVAALQDAFWTTAHPESGDLELREGVYDFLDDPKRFPLLIRNTNLTDVRGMARYSFLQFLESRDIENKLRKDPQKADELLASYTADGKIRAEAFDNAVVGTDESYYASVIASLEECRAALDQLAESNCRLDHFGKKGRKLNTTAEALEEVTKQARLLLKKKQAEAPTEETPTVEESTSEESEESAEADAGWVDTATSEESPDEAPTAPVKPRARPSRPAPGGKISDADTARARIAEAAAFLREADATDPTSYVVVRALRLGELYQKPEPLVPSSLPRPDGEAREELFRLASEANWPELLAGAERALEQPENAAWLDVHRYALRALTELGREAPARAAAAILRAALSDYPDWPTTGLRDGTAAANPETRAWLGETFPAAPAPAAPTTPAYIPPPSAPEPARDSDDGAPEHPRDPWDLAQELARNGEHQQALALITRAVRDARTGRERFLRGLNQAELCLMIGRQAIASPLLESLARQVDELHLDQWEDPALCARVLGAFYRCLRGQSDSRAEAVYRRLCQLDIAQAMSLDETMKP
jgi:type VI secretion system ImpA family protein